MWEVFKKKKKKNQDEGAVKKMRFSAVQEDRYNVDLGQETPPNDVDESMMAATADDEAGGGGAVGEGQSMISNLPLLFANGYPTSLEKITLVRVSVT